MGRHCFYCGVGMKRPPRVIRRGWGGHPVDTETVDHVFPRRMIKHEVRSAWWHGMNQVFCCHGCNQRKGQMHPLQWLVICAFPGQLERLLVELGVPRRRVNKWLAKRSVPADA